MNQKLLKRVFSERRWHGKSKRSKEEQPMNGPGAPAVPGPLRCQLCDAEGTVNQHELVVLGCTHVLCVDCVNKIYNTPKVDGAGAPMRDTHLTACPYCRKPTVRGIAIVSGAVAGGVDGRDEVARVMVPPLLRRGNPKIGMRMGIVKDYRLYDQQWGPQHAPKQ